MKRSKNKLLVIAFLLVGVFPFVGIERIIGDHEMGISWVLFFKHYPTLQLHYQNPAYIALETVPFQELSQSEQLEFIDYCTVRFGIKDVKQCNVVFSERMI